MNKFTKLLFALCLAPLLAFSQEAPNNNWRYQGSFPDTSQYGLIAHIHGLAVDNDGNVYIMPYYSSLRENVAYKNSQGADSVVNVSSNGVFVFKADGTPLDTIRYAPTIGDTIGGGIQANGKWDYNTGRGMRYNPVNNCVYIVMGGTGIIYRYNVETKDIDKKYEAKYAIGSPSFDGEGNVYFGPVTGSAAAIKKISEDLDESSIEEVGAPGGSFSRGFAVTEDGTVLWAGYTNGFVLRYAREDAFSPYQEKPDTVLRGIKAESFAFHPNGDLYLSAGSGLDLPGESPITGYAYAINSWYAFDVSTLGTAGEVPKDSLSWSNYEGARGDYGRARAIAFDKEGENAYIGLFSYTKNATQKLTLKSLVSNERVAAVPNGYSLKDNYPNPFNPSTKIEFEMAAAGFVNMNVYDMLGRKVATIVNSQFSAGTHTVNFDASNLASGTYMYVLDVNGVRLTKKMTLIK